MRNSPPTGPEFARQIDRTRYFTHPFDNASTLLGGESGGGMGSVFQAEKASRRRVADAMGTTSDELVILSMDPAPFGLEDLRMRVQPVEGFSEGTNIGDFYWDIYDDYDWNLILHPNSVTAPKQDRASLERIFKLHVDTRASLGDLDYARDYILQHGVAAKVPSIREEMVRKYGPQVEAIKPNSVVHWSMHSMLRVMRRYWQKLNAKNCYQTYHHHFPLPGSLHLHPEGREILQTMCRMDAIYFHTDDDIQNFLAQCVTLGLTPPKTVARFKLGIDAQTLEHDANRITKDNFRDEMRNYHNLQPGQRRSLEAIAQAEELKIPHQFVCTDRVDMHKGIAVLLQGVRQFLEAQGKSANDLAKEYRFFFFHELFDIANYEDHRLRHQYIKYVKELYDALEADFPGVIVVSQSIPKEAIPWVIRGKTQLNASTHDGKNLSAMEGVFIASLQDRDTDAGPVGESGVLVGEETGFAKVAKAADRAHLAHVVRPGDPAHVAESLHDVVRLKTEHPGELRRRMRQLAADVVLKEKDTVMPDPV